MSIHRFLAAVAILFWAVLAHAEPITQLEILGGDYYPNGGTIVCTGHSDWNNLPSSTWVNTTGKTLRVYSIAVWQGMSYGATADFGTWVNQLSTGRRLTDGIGWDHYAQPNAPNVSVTNFTPNWVELRPGDGLVTVLYCAPFSTSKKEAKFVSIWEATSVVTIRVGGLDTSGSSGE